MCADVAQDVCDRVGAEDSGYATVSSLSCLDTGN